MYAAVATKSSNVSISTIWSSLQLGLNRKGRRIMRLVAEISAIGISVLGHRERTPWSAVRMT